GPVGGDQLDAQVTDVGVGDVHVHGQVGRGVAGDAGDGHRGLDGGQVGDGHALGVLEAVTGGRRGGAAVADVQQAVGRAAARVADDAAGGGGGQRGGDLRGAGRGVVGQVQGGRSGDVRAGHGGAGDGVGGRVTGAPGGGDGGAGREQVEHRAVVGVARAGVAGGGGADRDGLGDPGGRLGGGVGGLVAGRDDEGDAGGDGVADGGVESAVGAAAEGHVGDGRLDRVAGHPVDAGDHLGGGAGAGVVQHPDG